jgi:hypothetical protein
MQIRKMITRSRVARLGVVLTMTAATVISTATPSYAAAGTLAVMPTRGPDGGGNVITAKLTAGTTGNFVQGAVAVAFSFATCDTTGWVNPTTITQASGAVDAGVVNVPDVNVIVNSTTELTITVPNTLALPAGATSGAFYVCAYPDRSTGDLIGGTASAGYTITDQGPLMSLSAYKGPAAGGNTITATAPSSIFITGNVFAEFQYDGCTALYKAAVPPAAGGGKLTAGYVLAPSVKLLSGTKLAVTVPALSLESMSSATYYLCVYDDDDTTNGDLIAQSSGYSVATGATITSVAPSAGSAQGGSTITITGTNLANATSVTIAGESAAITFNSAATILATVPAHSAGGPFTVSVTGPSGTVMKTGAFTYTNGIAVEPNTAPNTVPTGADIDVRGVGFAGLDFSATTGASNTTDNAKGHVYLVKGAYDPKAVGVTTNKTNPQQLECVNVLVVDDTELICTLYLGGVWADGSPTVPVTTSHNCTCTITAAALSTLVSTVAVFAQTDIGQMVTHANISPGTVITAVSTDLKTATLSKPASAAVTTAATFSISSGRSVADITTANNSKDAITGTGFFSPSDVGKAIKHSAIPVGTIITSVSNDLKTATMSNAATGTGTTVNIFPLIPVPVGTYTLTVVSSGATGAQLNVGYSQSIISSGSTFTVADY